MPGDHETPLLVKPNESNLHNGDPHNYVSSSDEKEPESSTNFENLCEFMQRIPRKNKEPRPIPIRSFDCGIYDAFAQDHRDEHVQRVHFMRRSFRLFTNVF